jgi:hypothetical protein
MKAEKLPPLSVGSKNRGMTFVITFQQIVPTPRHRALHLLLVSVLANGDIVLRPRSESSTTRIS